MPSPSPEETSPEEIRVLLVDATNMACQLLADAIGHEEKINVVAAVTTPGQASKIVTELSPNIALISEQLNGEPMAGFRLARELQTINKQMLVVMLLDSSNSISIVEAFRAGASGVFNRDGCLESLRKCILTVVRGQVWVSTEELRFVLAALSSSSTPMVHPENLAALTAREREVVRLAAEGIKNREIAQALGISQHTVKNYLFSIFKKLGISNRVELTLAFKQPRMLATDAGSMQSPATSGSNDILAWLRVLAAEGHLSAQLLLAEMYREGRGVPRDQAEAYRLLSLAENSARIGDMSLNTREKLATSLTTMPIADVERQATIRFQDNTKARRNFPPTKSRDAFSRVRRPPA